MIDVDILDYVILKLGSYVASGISKREENKTNKTIDVLLDIKDNKKVSNKDILDALLYALKKLGDFSMEYEINTKEFEEIDKVCDELYNIIKNKKY